jgi:hypothetical protein
VKCTHRFRHVDLFIRYCADGTVYEPTAPQGEPVSWRCARCHDYCSLGPSADEPEEVKVEMRAAEISAAWKPIGGVTGIITDDERKGWCDAKLAPFTDGYHAGFLAYHLLAGHDNEVSPIDDGEP